MSLRDRLKHETRQSHDQLESQLDLLRDDLTLDELRTLLERFYGYYIPCEAEVGLLAEAIRTFLANRAKSPHLEADLRYFGHDADSLAALPRCPLSPADSTPRALGRWYVLEGSTLGGQVLSRHFADRWNLDATRGCAFFGSYGPRLGAMWKEYCQVLEDHASPETDDEVVAAAQQTFESLATWLA